MFGRTPSQPKDRQIVSVGKWAAWLTATRETQLLRYTCLEMSRLRLQIYPTMPCAEYFGLEVREFKVRSVTDALLDQRSSAEPSEGVVWDQTTAKGLARFFNPSYFSYYSENMRHLSPCLQTQHRRFPSSKHISSHVWIRTKESIKFFISGTDARGNTSQRLFLKGYFSAYLNLVTQLPQTSIPTGH